MKGKKTGTALVFLLIVLVFAVLARLSWDFVRDTIATPAYYLLWQANIVLKALSQQVYLALPGRRSARFVGSEDVHRTNRAIDFTGRPNNADISRITGAVLSFWRRHCARLKFSRFSREQFAPEAKFILAIWLIGKASTLGDVATMTYEGALDVPEPVKT